MPPSFSQLRRKQGCWDESRLNWVGCFVSPVLPTESAVLLTVIFSRDRVWLSYSVHSSEEQEKNQPGFSISLEYFWWQISRVPVSSCEAFCFRHEVPDAYRKWEGLWQCVFASIVSSLHPCDIYPVHVWITCQFHRVSREKWGWFKSNILPFPLPATISRCVHGMPLNFPYRNRKFYFTARTLLVWAHKFMESFRLGKTSKIMESNH